MSQDISNDSANELLEYRQIMFLALLQLHDS